MTLARRLLGRGGGGSGFTPPAYTVSGPYSPASDHTATVLTQLHCHTTSSDGTYSPAAVVADYLGRGYGALALTDHNTQTAQPAGITTAILGNELGVGTSMQHIIALESSYDSLAGETDAQTIIDNVRAGGGEAHIAHPNWIGTSLSAATLAGLTDYYGMEIHNGKVLGGVSSSPVTYPGFAVSKWDAVLASKRDTWAVAVDDLHDITAFNSYDTGRVQVFAASNTMANIVSSLVAGNFVADVANYGVTPGYPYRSPAGLSVTCPGAVRIEAWGSDGFLDATDSDSHAHTFDGTQAYVRLVAVGDYTEPFDGSSLPFGWYAMDGTWTVGSGVLSLAGTSTARHVILRRHREGDFTAQVDIKLEDGGGYESANLLFNVLNANYWYALRIGQSASGTYNDKLAAYYTTDGGSALTLVDSDDLTVSMDTFYTVKMEYTASTGRIQAKAWETGTSEPAWMLDAMDTTWKWGGFGIRANYTPDFDNLYISGFRTYYQPVAVD